MNEVKLSPDDTHRLMSLMAFLSNGLMEHANMWKGDCLSKEMFMHSCSAIWDVCKKAQDSHNNTEHSEESIILEADILE